MTTETETEDKKEFYEYCFADLSRPIIIDFYNPHTKRGHFGSSEENIKERYPGAKLMKVSDFRKEADKKQSPPIQWIQTTQEKFNYAFEVVPPAYYRKNSFLLGEPIDHRCLTGEPRYEGFIQTKDGFFVTNRPVTEKEFEEAVKGF